MHSCKCHLLSSQSQATRVYFQPTSRPISPSAHIPPCTPTLTDGPYLPTMNQWPHQPATPNQTHMNLIEYNRGSWGRQPNQLSGCYPIVTRSQFRYIFTSRPASPSAAAAHAATSSLLLLSCRMHSKSAGLFSTNSSSSMYTTRRGLRSIVGTMHTCVQQVCCLVCVGSVNSLG